MPITDDLLDLRGIGQRGTSFRFDWLDNDDTKLGELHPVRDEGTPTITCDSTRAVTCDMANLNLIPSEAAAVDRLRHRVHPHMLLDDGSEWPLGKYVWADSSSVRNSYGLPMASSLVDLGIALNQPTPSTVSYPAATPIRQAIISLIKGSARVTPIVESTDATIVAPLTWPAGTLRQQIIADLCTLGGYLPPRFDMDGNCIVSLAPDPDDLPDPVVSFNTGNIYASTPIESDDLLQTPNRYIVTSTSPSGAAVAGFYDVPASAPYSAFNRGYVVSESIDQQGVASATDAAAAAKAIALSRNIYEHVTFSCPPDPRVDIYDTIEYIAERWFVQSWALTLKPEGPMTITARKVYS